MSKDDKIMEIRKEGIGKNSKTHENEIRRHNSNMVHDSMEESLNDLLDAEADKLLNIEQYERNVEPENISVSDYMRKLQAGSGEVKWKATELGTLPFENTIIARYKAGESSVEEAIIQMYLITEGIRKLAEITGAARGSKGSPDTITDLRRKIRGRIEIWRERAIQDIYPYLFLDGISLERHVSGEVENVSILAAFGVNQNGYREVLGIVEGGRENHESWSGFLRQLIKRGLNSVQLVTSDKYPGLVETIGECLPEARCQRCVSDFKRDVLSVVPGSMIQEVAAMLEAIHGQKDQESAGQKMQSVIVKLERMKLKRAADKIRNSAHETLSYYFFSSKHWRSIKSKTWMEEIMWEIRRHVRVVGNFPDHQSALILVAAHLRHISGKKWGTHRYLNMRHLAEMTREAENE